MSLHQLIYISKATEAFTKSELQDLLAKAKENNSSLDITGYLVYNGGRFLQILEGDKNIIENLFNQIKLDKRHHSVRMIYLEPAEFRLFTSWSMHMVNLDSDTPKNLSTLKAILEAAQSGALIDNMPAPVRLLNEFRNL